MTWEEMGAPYHTPAGISKPHSPNHWDSSPSFTSLPLLHSGTETQGPTSKRPSLSLPTASVFSPALSHASVPLKLSNQLSYLSCSPMPSCCRAHL